VLERAPATALVACALIAAAGCGGDDRKEVEQTVREFVVALNERDADKFCEELVTRDFLEKQTLAGDNAQADCKTQLKQIKGLRVKLVRIGSVRVDEDRARVKAVLLVQSQETDQLYRLRKEDGDWRIAAGSGG
jgi:hypothetical protein